MLQCMSIIHVSFHFKPFRFHWWHKSHCKTKMRKNSIEVKYAEHTHTWREREREKRKHIFSCLNYGFPFLLVIFIFKKKEMKMTSPLLFFLYVSELKCMPWHCMEKSEYIMKNCRKCGTRIKYINAKGKKMQTKNKESIASGLILWKRQHWNSLCNSKWKCH